MVMEQMSPNVTPEEVARDTEALYNQIVTIRSNVIETVGESFSYRY
jgi:hypothetical protein